jgi:hypothetical protein
MYGCDHTYPDRKYKNFLLRTLPAIFSNISDIFKFDKCSFKCEKTKDKTGRIVCFKELGIMHSFTQETTYYGRERETGDPENSDLHMSVADFKQIGVDLAKT